MIAVRRLTPEDWQENRTIRLEALAECPGNYFTSLEMVGATLTVMALDDELKALLDVEARCTTIL